MSSNRILGPIKGFTHLILLAALSLEWGYPDDIDCNTRLGDTMVDVSLLSSEQSCDLATLCNTYMFIISNMRVCLFNPTSKQKY